jgi:hypothetical protein
MVLASIFGGLGVVIIGLKFIVGLLESTPALSGPVVDSKKLEEYNADATLVILMVIVVPMTAVTSPLMRSVLE